MVLETAHKFLKALFLLGVFSLLVFLQMQIALTEYTRDGTGGMWILEENSFTVGIIDVQDGILIPDPVVHFQEKYFSNDGLESGGVLGIEEERIRVFNSTYNPSWALSLSAQDIDTKWESDTDSYFYNHPTDESLGRLTVNPEEALMHSTCDYSDLSVGSQATFQRGLVDNIDLVYASKNAPYQCYFDIWNIYLQQIVPPSQPVGTYSLPMILTVTVIPVEPSIPLNFQLIPSDQNILLEWDTPISDGGAEITGYRIERYVFSWVTLVQNTGTTNTSYYDETTEFGIVYSYRISAINGVGAGPLSSIESAFMVFSIEYIPSLGGMVHPAYQQVGLGANVDPPIRVPYEDYVLGGFEIINGEGNGELNPLTGAITNVVGNMIIQANFVYSPTITIEYLSAGDSHSLGLDQKGVVWAWGRNNFGQLGNHSFVDSNAPVKVMTEFGELENIVKISAGGNHNLALDENGNVWAWGLNDYGQLGDGGIINSSFAKLILNLQSVVDISAGGWHNVVLDTNSNVWAWGRNDSGQLGDNTTVVKYTPVQVLGGAQGGVYLGGISQVASGELHSFALCTSSRVWSWGENGSRQLGDGSSGNRRTPVGVKNVQQGQNMLENIVEIASGYNHSFALETLGDLRSWGGNLYGQLGDNTTTDRQIAVRVLSGAQGGGVNLNNISNFAGGRWHSLMLDNDGNVWAWGRNNFGQLGDNQVIGQQSLLPILIPSPLENIQSITSGDSHNLALDDEGNIWVWGLNNYGQLGDGTQINKHVPVQIELKI